MTDRWIVFISDRDQLKKLECEPESVLSSEEALHEVQPKSCLAFIEYGWILLKHISLP